MSSSKHHASTSEAGETHSPSSRRTYVLVYVALLVLLVLTVGVATLDLGVFSAVVAMSIALVKALLVAVFFMHLDHASPMVRVFAGAAILWLLLLFTVAGDYLAGNAVTQGL